MTKNFKKIREIGRGGMATVYLARDTETNRLVAVKVLKTNVLTDRDYIRRFFREARLTAQLEHPNIIKILESNFAEGNFYIVTEFVEGGDFGKMLSTPSSTAGPVPMLRKKLSILNTVLAALEFAHQRGIVHRDVKPSNILLTRELEPKLSDFGIAAALWGQESRYTRTDEIVGTMDYIAPEQKESSKNVDLRADIYSIGVIMYQLITGRKPMGAFPPPKRICPSIPESLDDIVMKCLQPQPVDRYKSANNLSLELAAVLQQLSPAYKPKPLPETGGQSGGHPGGHPGENPPTTGKDEDQTRISERSADTIHAMMERLERGTIAEKLNIKTRFLSLVHQDHEEKLLELLTAEKTGETGGVLQETVIQALGKIKSKKACPFLIELLSDPYYNKFAAEAIGDIGCTEPEAEEKLFKILLTHNETAYIALIPLGKLNSHKSVDLIAEYLANRHAWIREMALTALAMITDGKVNRHIEHSAQKDPDANIRAKAKKILWRLNP